MSFSLAVNERVRDGDGWADRASWVPCVVFGNRAAALARIIHKGSKVSVSGHLHESRWMHDDERRSRLELIVEGIEFLSPGRGMGGQGGQAAEVPYE